MKFAVSLEKGDVHSLTLNNHQPYKCTLISQCYIGFSTLTVKNAAIAVVCPAARLHESVQSPATFTDYPGPGSGDRTSLICPSAIGNAGPSFQQRYWWMTNGKAFNIINKIFAFRKWILQKFCELIPQGVQ